VKIGALAFALLLTGTTAAPAQRPGGPPPRGELEAELRRGFARAVRQRVGLSEDQMRRLAPITQKHATERARIQLDEREARMELGRILRDSVSADSARVERLLARMLEVEKRRTQLMEQEQRDLATIMSPVQRARFLGLQEQMRRQLEERRRGRGQGGPPPRRGPPPD
jgi:Spy/CpxP family protein refolding chaperone